MLREGRFSQNHTAGKGATFTPSLPILQSMLLFRGDSHGHSSLVNHLFHTSCLLLSPANHILMKSSQYQFSITKDSLPFHIVTSYKSILPPNSSMLSFFYSTPTLMAWLATSNLFLSGKGCGLGGQR